MRNNMNLFESTTVVQVIRDEYDLTIPQAICVLIAYELGSVSSMTAREVMGYDARSLSGNAALSMPVRKKLLREVGKARVKHGSRPSGIYQLTDADAIKRLVNRAQKQSANLNKIICCYEGTAQEAIRNAD
jgi:hypothetical protein